ncbi:hypothetical protein GOV03_02955 [Candidatus Woesearchaeota archaeon]|nr:hypothetical protein [Candidatus Woesearchaeota archaeon]
MNGSKAMAWFIVLLMTFSILGIVGSSFFSEEVGREKYNGFDLIKANNLWLLRSEGKEYYFQHLPSELEDLAFPTGVVFDAPRIYLGFQPNDKLNVDKTINSLAYVFYNYGVTSQKACTIEDGCPDIPIMNCQEKVGIVIVSGETNSYTRDEKCLIMTAVDNQELGRLTERLTYGLLGVMD